MNTPNPLVPQGSLPEAAKRKANIRIAIFTILAIHVALLGGLLMQGGCKPEEKKQAKADITALTNDSPFPTLADSNYLSAPVTPAESTTLAATPAPSSPNAAGFESSLPAGPTGIPKESKEYSVAKGDTLAKIAKAHGVTLKAIEEANPGVVPTKLKVNQKIQVPLSSGTIAGAKTYKAAESAMADPSSTVYTVKAGDSLFKIARQQGTTVKAIRSANQLRTDQLRVGQKLKVPVAKSTTDTANLEPATIPATIATSNPLPASPSNTANRAR